MDLTRLRDIKGLEDLHDRACTDVSPLVHPNGSPAAVVLGLAASRACDPTDLHLIFVRLAGWTVLPAHSEVSKDAELLVLRREGAALWWQNPKRKLDRADRAMLATLRAAAAARDRPREASQARPKGS